VKNILLEDFFNIRKIGSSLGIEKEDFHKIYIFDNSKYPNLYKFLLFVLLIVITVYCIIASSTIGIVVYRNTYASGTLYSTARIKNFQKDHRFKVIKKLLKLILK
jgi:hypothetical protein